MWQILVEKPCHGFTHKKKRNNNNNITKNRYSDPISRGPSPLIKLMMRSLKVWMWCGVHRPN